jgi:nitrogenase cofactor biosynthesis protein NifB
MAIIREIKKTKNDAAIRRFENDLKSSTHPCFGGCKGGNARIHLPVAPACNIQCNYCVRKFDCANESRPGVTTSVLNPQQAVDRYTKVKADIPNLTVVGIAGPGDALADWDKTKPTLEAIRAVDDKVTFCLSTNGLLLPQYADEIIELGVSHMTITMNGFDPVVVSKIYKHIDYKGQRLTGLDAAKILIDNQFTGLRILANAGLVVKVNIVACKGINEGHIPALVERVKEYGATITNIMRMIPVEGAAFEHLEPLTNEEIKVLRNSLDATLPQMYHCRQCRADAIGTLYDDQSAKYA